MTVFENIKKIAKIRGLSLQDVAIKSGMSANAIYRYNQGSNPSGPTLSAIANTLHVNVDQLLGTEPLVPMQDDNKKVDILDDEVILAFDGMDISDEDREKLLDYARYIIETKKGK